MTSWYDDAACHPDNRPADMTPAQWCAIWYPVPEAPKGRRPTKTEPVNLYDPARNYCNKCPVKEQCLKQAMVEEHGAQRFGMRGGLTWRERGALPRRTCRWCHEWFPVNTKLISGGRHPHFCSDGCRDNARAEVRIQSNERQRIARWTDDTTECDVCGFESRTTSGLAAHRRQLHGKAVA